MGNRSPRPPQRWRASWGQSLLRKHDPCTHHEVISVFCSPSIFKLIIWKQAAVNFGHRLSDEMLRPLLPFGFFYTTPMTLGVTLDTKSQPCWPIFPTQQSFCCNGTHAHFHVPLRNAAVPCGRATSAQNSFSRKKEKRPLRLSPSLLFSKLYTAASSHMFVQRTRRFL